ncbi:hypothetical protein ES705_39073 [subsurface metagenome]
MLNPAYLTIFKASFTCFDRARFDCRVANDLIYTLGVSIAFIRILSPSKAPPVLRFEGSTEMIAIVIPGKSTRNLLISSSTSDDLPAPPVPVIPITGVLFLS